MTDVTSEKLYSKLDRINKIKRNLKKIMTEIGGYEYFQDDPKFETYPEILGQIQTRISTINRALDITVYGVDPTEAVTTADTTYKKVLPYLDELQLCRALLIDNLNTKGVRADTNETLRSLVGKVLDISGGAKEPFNEILLSVPVDNLMFQFIYGGTYSNDGRFFEYLNVRVVNNDDVVHNFIDTFYRVSISNESNMNFSCFIRDTVVYPHTTTTYGLFGSYEGSSSYEDFRDFIDDIKSGDFAYSIDDFHQEDARTETLQFNEDCSVDLEIYPDNRQRYLIIITTRTDDGHSVCLDSDYLLKMYSPDGERYYVLAWYDEEQYIYDNSWNWNYLYAYSEIEEDDFSYWETNEITLEEDDYE